MTRRREVLTGVVIIAGIVVGVFGTLWLEDSFLGRRAREVEAVFHQVGNLLDGHAVKFRGVSIGRVEKIFVEPGGEAVRVLMRIREDIELPEDAVVILSPESMFGDWRAEIAARSLAPDFPYPESRGDGVMVGYALPDISRLTQTAGEIAANLKTLTDRVAAAFTEELAKDIQSAVQNIQDVSQQLNQLVAQQKRSFEHMAADVRETAEDLGEAVRAARSAFVRIESMLSGENVDSMLASAQIVLDNLRESSIPLPEAMGRLREMLDRADTTFMRLNRIAARVEAGEGAAGMLLSDSTLATMVEGVLTELQELFRDVRENPRRYFRLTIF